MNGLCSLDNVVYQAIIYPKEDISDKKYYIGLLLISGVKKIKLLYHLLGIKK